MNDKVHTVQLRQEDVQASQDYFDHTTDRMKGYFLDKIQNAPTYAEGKKYKNIAFVTYDDNGVRNGKFAHFQLADSARYYNERVTGEYLDNQKHGVWKSHSPHAYLDHHVHVVVQTYHKDALRSEAEYTYNSVSQKHYDENGVLIAENYKMPAGHSVDYPVVDGQKQGLAVAQDEDGRLINMWFFKDNNIVQDVTQKMNKTRRTLQFFDDLKGRIAIKPRSEAIRAKDQMKIIEKKFPEITG